WTTSRAAAGSWTPRRAGSCARAARRRRAGGHVGDRTGGGSAAARPGARAPGGTRALRHPAAAPGAGASDHERARRPGRAPRAADRWREIALLPAPVAAAAAADDRRLAPAGAPRGPVLEARAARHPRDPARQHRGRSRAPRGDRAAGAGRLAARAHHARDVCGRRARRGARAGAARAGRRRRGPLRLGVGARLPSRLPRARPAHGGARRGTEARAHRHRHLGLVHPAVIVSSPHRHNLVFDVRSLRGDEKLRHLAKLARRLPRPGIIYCSTTKTVEDVWLGLRLIKVPCARYHGKMTDKDRAAHQARFMRKGKRIVMVATSAFGLGIDKPDIRYIVHYQAPASLERYVQEAGRAGRDGHPARCILLFDESDLEIQEHLLALSRLSPALLGRFGRALSAWAAEHRDANIEELALSAGISQRAASSIVTALVEAGICERVDAGRIHALGPLETLVERVESLRERFEIIRREDGRRLKAVVDYVNERECRSVALRRYFGDPDPAPCGRCDLCRAHGVAAPGRPFGRRRRRGRDRRLPGVL